MSGSIPLSASELNALVITERVNSCLSMVGIFFVLITYSFSSHFDKPINRLIFFATWGNIGSTIASLISDAGPLAVAVGQKTAPLCQFQGFLVQMFLGVDAYWAVCMAVNVYLVFFRGYSTGQLRNLDFYYLIASFILSFIPAITFVFISNPSQGPVYGPAIIWCWITPSWDWMRIVFLYAIVWVAIVFAFVVYAMTGKVIWNKRRHLDGFLNPLNENPFTQIVTTEIEITHQERFFVKEDDEAPITSERPVEQFTPYSVNVQVDPQAQPKQPMPAPMRMRGITRDIAEAETNPDAWLYARVAFLFFLALLITWVPSSVNRVYAMVRPNEVNFALNYVSSFVFPLQGFWNVIVYIITSQQACRALWNSITRRGSAHQNANFGPSFTGGIVDRQQRFPSGSKQRLRSISSFSIT
ncbi:hypothetical protein LOCC1_G002063 [Lachnellula occidentalis]|uniref:G-protein coupled receptors family 2 profile 2 domain-containing protein n=1 Tax=Lachnellula occidentalis TaxID=215460 RepID=A0A8H8S852_9HELO|nr:hypothetical protein LOCC1_G002063 [Lachnellula occidentalis]